MRTPSIKRPSIQSDNDNLNIMPPSQKSKHRMVSLGDLHGNALKLLHFLIKQGVVTTTKEQYEQFVKDYHTIPVTEKVIRSIEQIISKLTINQDVPFLRFIGDELADRGTNDYYTLLLFDKLHQNGVQFDTLQSNHTVEFFLSHEKAKQQGGIYKTPPRLGGQGASMLNLMLSVSENKWVEWSSIDSLVEMHKKHQRIISYSLNDTGITIYSHAPVDHKIIRALAAKFNVIPFLDRTPDEMAYTIERINNAYINAINQPGGLTHLINDSVLLALGSKKPFSNDDIMNHPLEYIVWNREYSRLMTSPVHPTGGYSLSYVHGHDSTNRNQLPHVTCLDSEFGKNARSDFEECNHWKAPNGTTYLITTNPILHDDGHLLTPQMMAQFVNAITKSTQPHSPAPDNHPHNPADHMILPLQTQDAFKPSATAEMASKIEIIRTQAQKKEQVPEPEPEQKKNAYENEGLILAHHPRLSDFKEKLDLIKIKEGDLRKRGFISASECANNLHKSLISSYDKLLSQPYTPQQVQQFQSACIESIKKAKPELETHRGWKRVLGNIMLAIVGVGVIYAVATIIHFYVTKKDHFLFFNETDSANILDILTDTVMQKQNKSSNLKA